MTVRPVDAGSWDDVATVLGRSGGTGGCWCMSWRISAAAYEQNGPDGNETLLRETVCSGRPVGVLAYAADEPVGWCSVSPREDYGRIVRSPALRLDNLDDPAAWSITCFFVRAGFRRQGVTAALRDGAIRYGEAQGARVLEGYPVGPEAGGRAGAARRIDPAVRRGRIHDDPAAVRASRGHAPRAGRCWHLTGCPSDPRPEGAQGCRRPGKALTRCGMLAGR